MPPLPAPNAIVSYADVKDVFRGACLTGSQRFQAGQVEQVGARTLPPIMLNALQALDPVRAYPKPDAYLSGRYYRVRQALGSFYLFVQRRQLEGEPERVVCGVVTPRVSMLEAIAVINNGKVPPAVIHDTFGHLTDWTTTSTLGYQLRAVQLRDRWVLISSIAEQQSQKREPTLVEQDLARSAAIIQER